MIFHLRALWGEIGDDGRVNYWLENLSGERVEFNDFVGKKITIKDQNQRMCRVCGNESEKLYNKGTCGECFKTHPRCDICMFKPELCHYYKGTCRDEQFAKEWCFNNQIIYFSLTSGPKVGYLSMENHPQRWIDQGATKAIKVADAKSRLEAGEIETYLAQFMKDKTNWTAMLKGQILEDADLLKLKNQWKKQIELRWPGRLAVDDEILELKYPIISYPQKTSLKGLENAPEISGVLTGIRGQYLLFKDYVFSIKKHEGFVVDIKVEEPTLIEVVSQAKLFE